MNQKRLKQLVIAGAVLTALVLDSSASARAATDGSGSSSTTTVAADTAAKASAAPLTVNRGGSVRATHGVRDNWIRDLYLTDHEQYVRHHQRLASQA
jgi:hypothetical protein